MGFSIGRFLGKIAGPIIGAIIPGPLGGVIGGAISAGVGGASPPGRVTTPPPAPATVTTTQTVPFAAPTRSFQSSPTRFRGPTSFVGGGGTDLLLRGARGLGKAAGGAALVEGALNLFGGGSGDAISEILAQARQNVRGATKNKIIAAAKVCGISLAAETYGLSDTQICQVIVAGRTRRRRGISAADIRRTKRTIRFVSSLRKDLKKVSK